MCAKYSVCVGKHETFLQLSGKGLSFLEMESSLPSYTLSSHLALPGSQTHHLFTHFHMFTDLFTQCTDLFTHSALVLPLCTCPYTQQFSPQCAHLGPDYAPLVHTLCTCSYTHQFSPLCTHLVPDFALACSHILHLFSHLVYMLYIQYLFIHFALISYH